MRKQLAAATIALVLAMGAHAQAEDLMKTEVKPSNAVRVFDPAKGAHSGQDYVLPFDSPIAEHGAASIKANAVSFTKKTDAGEALPVAFTCIRVKSR